MEIPEGYANVRFIFTADGVLDPMSFAVGVFPELGGSATDIAEAAADAIGDANLVEPITILQGWHFVGTSATLTTGGEPLVGEANRNIDGELTGESIMVNGAILVKKVTAFGGRKNRGRMFVPPYLLNESAVANSGVIETATQGPIQTLFTAFHAALIGQDLTPTLFHSSPVDLPTPIDAFVVQSLMATQRRRMR